MTGRMKNVQRNRRGQIDVESPEIKEDIKSEDENETRDLDEDEILVDLDFFSETESENRNCQQEQDPLQLGSSSISPGVSRHTNSRQNLDKGNGVTFRNKLEFTVEMQKEVSLIVEECTQVLKNDPREYHPFYLTVHKWIEVGLKQGHIPEKKTNVIWEKCDAFAVAQLKKDQDSPINTARNDKPQSEYLQYILAQKETKCSIVSRGVRSVERKWKRDIADEDPYHHKHCRTNLSARLKFFLSAKCITSPEDCVQMNSLWNRLLSSKLVQTPTFFTFSRTQQENPSPNLNKNVKDAESKDKRALYNEQRQLKRQQGTEEEKETRRKEVNEQTRLRRSRESEEARSKRVAKNAQQKKIRREQMTPEEEQAVKDKQAEETRKRRKKQLEKMTPEEKQAVKDKHAEETRKRRKKQLEKMTPEERQSVKEKDAEMAKLRRAKRLEKLSPTEMESWRDKQKEVDWLWRDKKLVKMTAQENQVNNDKIAEEREKEKENLRQIRELQKRLKLDEVSLEEKVQIRVKIRELSKPRLEKVKALRKAFMEGLSEEDRFQYKMNTYLKGQAKRARSGRRKSYSLLAPDLREYIRQSRQKYKKDLPPEKKQKLKESNRRSAKKFYEKIKQDPVKFAEVYKPQNEWYKRRHLTVEQARKRQKRVNEYQRRKTEKETEEQRRKRLTRYKVYQARIKLRKEMEEEEDFTEEEFEKRLEDIVKQIKAQPIPPSEYKPRPRKAPPNKEVPGGSVDNVEDEESIPMGGMEKDLPVGTNGPVLEMELQLSTSAMELPEENFSIEPVSSLEVNPASQLTNCGTLLFESETFSEPEPEHEVVDCSWSPESSRHSPMLIENEQVPVLPPQNESIFQSAVSVEVEGASEEVTLNEKLVGEGDEGKPDESSLETLVECEHCMEQFSLEEDLRSHIRSKHRGKCWTCPMCKKVILSPAELVEHFQTEHNEEGEALPGNENVKEPTRLIQGNSKVRKRSGRRKRM